MGGAGEWAGGWEGQEGGVWPTYASYRCNEVRILYIMLHVPVSKQYNCTHRRVSLMQCL